MVVVVVVVVFWWWCGCGVVMVSVIYCGCSVFKWPSRLRRSVKRFSQREHKSSIEGKSMSLVDVILVR